ncbi:hypothetical protein DSM104443_01517 [Usitatibacter rugosus]|uniref:OsmC-like protein n=1 Tax=Usitatibacter rugosus TaxID=2732067 RepID=A0A6M4GVT0_9PROT|nr:OsmC family protein [Usitatibacter rugosus]QJR10453.1 hypothetical protein DSM104443_01517 [Usitatibacter rugosus]
MNSHEFVALQAPLKRLYRTNERAALLTLKAQGTLDEPNLTCKVDTGRGLAVAGLHEATGGTGLELCSGDMLLEALVACAGVSLRAAATLLDIQIHSGRVWAEGDVDLRGCLGMEREVPVGFKEIRLRFDVQSNASPEQLDELLRVTEQYCVVNNTLRAGAKVAFDLDLSRGY